MTKYLRFTITAANRVATSAFVTLSHRSSWSASAVVEGEGHGALHATSGHLDERGAMLAIAELLGAGFAETTIGVGSSVTLVGIDPHPTDGAPQPRRSLSD